MLKSLMEDNKIDLDAPLLSVRRHSAEPASPTPSTDKGEEQEGDPQPPPHTRRASLPFYRSDLKTGPVCVPGVVPFVWEQTPGQPKNGVAAARGVGGEGIGRPVLVPRPLPGRIGNVGVRAASASVVKPGSSVRTRKAVTFAPDTGAAKSTVSAEDGPDIAAEEETDKLEKVAEAERIKKKEKVERTEKAEKVERIEKVEKVDVPERIAKSEEAEDKPGKAKKVENKPEEPPISAVEKHDAEEDEDDDAFSDALDTLSRSESFFMNCSVSGLSGLPDAAAKHSDSFPKDPQVRDFMMERFLPAAKAMACDSPQYTYRKAAGPRRDPAKPVDRVVGLVRRPAPIPHQNKPNYLPPYARELEEEDSSVEDEEDEDYCEDASHFTPKGCGLLPKFCFKSSFCLLNPVPGMKVRGRLPPAPRGRSGSPRIRNAHRTGDELFREAVQRKKLGQEYHLQAEAEAEEVSKLRCESDSPTADGSSPHVHSNSGGTPDLNEGLQSSLHERNGSLGVQSRESKSSKTDGSETGEKDMENDFEVNHHSRMVAGSVSPALEKTLYVDSGNRPGSSDSRSSSFSTVKDTRSTMNSSELDNESKRNGESIVAEAPEHDALRAEDFKVSMPVRSLPSERSKFATVNGHNNLNHGSYPLHLKKDHNHLHSLLSPPLPKTPSESWLSRTLPSVTSKNPSPGSLLGIQLQPRKQTLNACSPDIKQETIIKPSKPQNRQIRFAEVLAKPESPKSQI